MCFITSQVPAYFYEMQISYEFQEWPHNLQKFMLRYFSSLILCFSVAYWCVDCKQCRAMFQIISVRSMLKRTLANNFILLASRLISWSSSRTNGLPGGKMMTLDPHQAHSVQPCTYTMVEMGHWQSCVLAHSCSTYWRTCERIGSVSIHLLILSDKQ